MAKRIGVVLSGCGVMDGSEIHESVCTLLAIDQSGATALCMAPDIPQMHVVNHLAGEPEAGDHRNVLLESARIARGRIRDLKSVRVEDLDAVIFPGGFGAVKNLCTYATDGANCTVDPQVMRLATDMIDAGKPIGVICIAPALLARIAGERKLHPKLTIGNDRQTAATIAKMGAEHCQCTVSEFVVDEENKIVSTPAYMLAERISEVYDGVRKLVDAVIKLC